MEKLGGSGFNCDRQGDGPRFVLNPDLFRVPKRFAEAQNSADGITNPVRLLTSLFHHKIHLLQIPGELERGLVGGADRRAVFLAHIQRLETEPRPGPLNFALAGLAAVDEQLGRPASEEAGSFRREFDRQLDLAGWHGFGGSDDVTRLADEVVFKHQLAFFDV